MRQDSYHQQSRVVANDSADHLAKNMSADHKLVIRCEGNPADVKKLLSAIPGMDEVFVNRGECRGGRQRIPFLNAVGTDIRRSLESVLRQEITLAYDEVQ